MENKKGQIQKISISEGLSKTTNKPYKRFEFVIDGKKYSTFHEDIGTAFKVGQFVEMEGEQKGNFWEMKTMRAIGEEEYKIGAPVEKVVTNDLASRVASMEIQMRQMTTELVKLNKEMTRILNREEDELLEYERKEEDIKDGLD